MPNFLDPKRKKKSTDLLKILNAPKDIDPNSKEYIEWEREYDRKEREYELQRLKESKWREWKKKQKDYLVRHGIPDPESQPTVAQGPAKGWERIAIHSAWGTRQFQRFKRQLVKDGVVFYRGKTPFAYPEDIKRWTKKRLKSTSKSQK